MSAIISTPYGLESVFDPLKLSKAVAAQYAQPETATLSDSLGILSDVPSSSFGDLGTGKSVVSVHLSSVFRLRVGLTAGSSPLLRTSTSSGVGFLVTTPVFPTGLVDFPLDLLVVVVAVTDLPAGFVGSLEPFLVAARVLPAGLSETSSGSFSIVVPAFPLALVDTFFVSFLIPVGGLRTAFFGEGFLATRPDFFPASVILFGAGILALEVPSPWSFLGGFFLGAIAVSVAGNLPKMRKMVSRTARNLPQKEVKSICWQ